MAVTRVGTTNVYLVDSQSEMLGLGAQRGDIVIRQDLAPDGVFVLSAQPFSELDSWIQVDGSGGGGLTAGSVLDSHVNEAAAIQESKLALASDAAPGTASRRTLGTGAQQACAGNDARLSDARTPTAHRTTHEVGGADALTGRVPGQTFEPTGLPGAVQVTRYVGGTTSGAPTSGTFSLGDWVIARNGHIWVCTAGGTPGTWVDAGAYGSGSSGAEVWADAPNGTDDTTALNNAYASAAGGILRLRPGTYKVASTLLWNTLGATVKGCGLNETLIEAVGAFAGPFVRVDAEKHAVSDLGFDGNYTANTGLTCYKAALSTFTRVLAEAFLLRGVLIDQSATTPTGNNNLMRFEACDFSRNDGHGLEIAAPFSDCNGITFASVTAQGNGNVGGRTAVPTSHGLYLRGNYHRVEGGIMEANKAQGIRVGHSSDGPASVGVIIDQPWLEGNAGNYNKAGGVLFSERAVRCQLRGSDDLQGREDRTATSENIFVVIAGGNNYTLRDSRLTAAPGAPTTSLNGAIGAGTAEAVENVVVTSTTGFAFGDFVQIDSEYLHVENVVDATTLSLRRGVYGSTNAAHSNGATVQVVTYTDLQLAAPNGFGYARLAVNDGKKGLTIKAKSFALGAGADPACNLGIGGNDSLVTFGNGAGVIGIENAVTVPPNNPTGGGILWVEGGALKYRGSSGTTTTIAVA